MAVEAAFPQCGISRVMDSGVEKNRRRMSDLQSGKAYHRLVYSGRLLSGSRPEGLAMDDNWGHDEADWELMYLYGGPLGVNVSEAQHPQGKSCLDFRPEGCPATYIKLLITDLNELRKHYKSKDWIEGSVHVSKNQCWLNTYQAVRGMQLLTGPISGPAAQSGTRDWVSTFVCNGPHPEMGLEFPNRPRQWPPASLINVILKLPMLMVLVGHKLSPEFKLQARISWSHLELTLIQELPESVRQGYIACKYVLKRFLKARRGQNEAGADRNCMSSYHVKTTFLRYLEKTPPSMIMSPFGLFLDLLHELDEYLKMRKLPQYFIDQCNLLETVSADELCISRQVIEEILSDPLNALLTSPTDFQQIYGKVHPDYLVVAFSRVSSHLTSEQYLSLCELLACVDKRRRHKYAEQLKSDKRSGVSGRVELIGLVDTLKHIKLD